MLRIIRTPRTLDQFFCSLPPAFHWDHFAYFRVLVVGMACAWGRRTVSNFYRQLDVKPHRARVNNFFLVQRWDPAAALRQKAPERRPSLQPATGDTISLVIDDSKKAKRGPHMEAVAGMKDSATDTSRRGPQDVGALLRCRARVIPYGSRRYVKPAHANAVGLPVHKTPALAAQLIRGLQPPPGIRAVVLFAAYSLCRDVFQARRDQHLHLASTLQGHRTLFKLGWQLKAGRDGKPLLRRRRTDSLAILKAPGNARSQCGAAGGLEVSTLGKLHVVFSRKGTEKKLPGLVPDAPELSAAGLL